MTPVAEWSVEESSVTGPASAFTPEREQQGEREDDGGVAEGEPEADRERLAAGVVGEQLARGVVDRGDVVGVEGVAQAEGVGQDADADGEDGVVAAEREVLRA